MPQLFSNNASSVLAAALTSSATSLTLAPGSGAKFPSPGGGNYFVLTLYQMSGSIEINHEIVRCTARAGDVLTIVRGQEGTTARAFNLADPVSMRLTAGALTPAALGAMDATASLGAVVLLATLTPGIAANLNFLNLFTPDYDAYRIVGTGITCANTDTLSLRLAVGGTVDAATNYVAVVAGISKSQVDSKLAILTIGATFSIGGNFAVDIWNTNSTTGIKSLHCNGSAYVSGTPTINGNAVFGRSDSAALYNAVNPVSGFQLFFAGGVNFGVGGNIRVFGFKNT